MFHMKHGVNDYLIYLLCEFFISSFETLAYIVVVFMFSCPSIFCTSVIGVPLLSKSVANVCLNKCGVNVLSNFARFPIIFIILSIASFF